MVSKVEAGGPCKTPAAVQREYRSIRRQQSRFRRSGHVGRAGGSNSPEAPASSYTEVKLYDLSGRVRVVGLRGDSRDPENRVASAPIW